MISLFGWLDNIPFWRDLPYPTKGALLRALKAGLSGIVGVLVTVAAAGTLFPPDWSPAIVILITSGLQALDKFLRENSAASDAAATPVPLTDNPDGT